ncbi:nuclear transport factor 2 family protein [Thermodesulfobacteriota bacterium]
MESALEKRITVLEDIEAIKKLKSIYCDLVDGGINGDMSKIDEFITYFIDDAWIDFGRIVEISVHRGKEAVTKFYKEGVCGLLSQAEHLVVNPIIDVDGDEAKGRWYVIVPCTVRETNSASWLFGKYEEEYVRIEGEWKWRSIIFRAKFLSAYEGEGWAKGN